MKSQQAAAMGSSRREPVVLVGVEAKGRIDGLLFELTIEQRYHNSTDSNIEAVYTFVVPRDAVLLDVEVVIADKTLKGVVVEKRAAETTYEEALDGGNTAIMLERIGASLLTANFGNLMPGEDACIRYAFAQLLQLSEGRVRVTVPTAIAPRYGDPQTAGLAPQQAPLPDPGVTYPFALAIDLAGTMANARIASPSHRIRSARNDDGVTVAIDGHATLDRDFVLTIDDIPEQALAIVEADDEGYVALASFPVARIESDIGTALRLKILIDCSGSMSGDSIDAARRALRRIFSALAARDYVSLSRFGNSIEHLSAGLVAAGRKTVEQLASGLAAMQADLGGTEMQAALDAVFAIDRDGEPADVLLVTDGEIWAADALIAAARSAGQRVFVVGIGSAPAEGVLWRLARATGGACEFVGPTEDPQDAIAHMVDRLRAPRLDCVQPLWPSTAAWSTTPPRGILGGETVHTFAGFAKAPAGDATLVVSRPASTDSRISIPLPPPSRKRVLGRLAAAQRLHTLDDGDTRLSLALRYELLTDQTNVVVMHERPQAGRAKELPALSRVPQMLAAGWGGVGTVGRPRLSLGVSVGEIAFSYSAYDRPAIARRDRRNPAAPPETVDVLLRALDRMIASEGIRALPATFDDLERLGVPGSALAELRALASSGSDEIALVETFLASLAIQSRYRSAGRRVLKALLGGSRPVPCTPDVQSTVDAIVAGFGPTGAPVRFLDAVEERAT